MVYMINTTDLSGSELVTTNSNLSSKIIGHDLVLDLVKNVSRPMTSSKFSATTVALKKSRVTTAEPTKLSVTVKPSKDVATTAKHLAVTSLSTNPITSKSTKRAATKKTRKPKATTEKSTKQKTTKSIKTATTERSTNNLVTTVNYTTPTATIVDSTKLPTILKTTKSSATTAKAVKQKATTVKSTKQPVTTVQVIPLASTAQYTDPPTIKTKSSKPVSIAKSTKVPGTTKSAKVPKSTAKSKKSVPTTAKSKKRTTPVTFPLTSSQSIENEYRSLGELGLNFSNGDKNLTDKTFNNTEEGRAVSLLSVGGKIQTNISKMPLFIGAKGVAEMDEGPVGSFERTTEKGDKPRLISPIFLTGIGDNLFEDNKGEINFSQEPDLTSWGPPTPKPSSPSRRRARFEEDTDSFFFKTETTEDANLNNIRTTTKFEIESKVGFVDSTLGEINSSDLQTGVTQNVTDEIKQVKAPSRRRARFEDFDQATWLKQDTSLATTLASMHLGKTGVVFERNIDLVTSTTDPSASVANMMNETLATQSVQNVHATMPSRRARFDDVEEFEHPVGSVGNVEHRTLDPIQLNNKTSTLKSLSEYTTTSILTSTRSTFENEDFVKNKMRSTERPRQFCNSANICNSALNERCVFNDQDLGVCNCRRSYVRHPVTRKCEAPLLLKTSLKLPGEVFHEDLKDKNSERFQQKRKDSVETMWLLLKDDPDLLSSVATVDVYGFESGSLIVHWDVVLVAGGNKSAEQFARKVDADIKEAFGDEKFIKSAPLNVENAAVLAVTNELMNPCEFSDMNYCSKNADCIKDDVQGFRCKCKGGFADVSKEAMYAGEVCIEACYESYCGDHGVCEVKRNGRRHCLCSSWYFGQTCSISGIVVIASFSVVNLIIILLAISAMCFCKRSRSNYYRENQLRFQAEQDQRGFVLSNKASDAIALDIMGSSSQPSKYNAVGTPKHHAPSIRLTSPSILGANISYDYDSSFDESPREPKPMEFPPMGNTLRV